jgi:hypothetical protein
MSHLEQQFKSLWECQHHQVKLTPQYRFAPPRRYTWDFADADRRIGIDVQGGIWKRKSAHAGGTAIANDCAKLCLATILGWKVFHLIDKTINDANLAAIADTIAHSPKLPRSFDDRELLYLCELPRSTNLLPLAEVRAGKLPKSKLDRSLRRILANFKHDPTSALWLPACRD